MTERKILIGALVVAVAFGLLLYVSLWIDGPLLVL
jgi:hypothetical protein